MDKVYILQWSGDNTLLSECVYLSKMLAEERAEKENKSIGKVRKFFSALVSVGARWVVKEIPIYK